MPKPVTILVGALGGDGGGVLCDWIVTAAHSHGLSVQATQIPGVAQRTGATTYYVEVMPTPGPSPSVLALNPAIGEVDVALATELLEAGVDLFSIQKILGHKSLATTAHYTHVRRSHLQEACRSLDLLPLEQLRQVSAPPPVLRKPSCRSKSAKSSAVTEPGSLPPAEGT